MDCNRRTAHEHIISSLKLSLAKQTKQTLPERLMQHLLTGTLALDVVQQSWLQTARLHYFIDLSPSMRHVAWQVAILRSYKSCRVKDVMVCVQFSKWVNYPCSGGLATRNITLSFGVSASSASWTTAASAQGWTDKLLKWTQTQLQLHVAFVIAPFIRT